MKIDVLIARGILPPVGIDRWVKLRKYMVLHAVMNGMVTKKVVEKVYGISAEEFDRWADLFYKGGADALKATTVHMYREGDEK